MSYTKQELATILLEYELLEQYGKICTDSYIFILERKYGKCKASQDLRRMTAELKMADDRRNKHFIIHKHCLAQYTFNEEDHDVTVVSHGNSNSTSTCRPYMKTKASVRKNLQDTLQNSSLTPARAVNQGTHLKVATCWQRVRVISAATESRLGTPTKGYKIPSRTLRLYSWERQTNCLR